MVYMAVDGSKSFDLYNDAHVVQYHNYDKKAIVKKNVSLCYVQEAFEDILQEDNLEVPWIFILTVTGLPRKVQSEDKILLEGVLYTVSRVRPVNRETAGVLQCLCYPERTDEMSDISEEEEEDGEEL